MELNALTRWESIGKDLYQSPEIARLKARSKRVEAQRDARHAARHIVDERLEGAEPASAGGLQGETPPTGKGSYSQLSELEQKLARATSAGALSAAADAAGAPTTDEERAILATFRALREKGKRLRLEEEIIERSTVQGREKFSGAEERWVHFFYRLLRRFGKGFLVGYGGKFVFSFLGLCLRHKLNVARLLPDVLSLLVKEDLLRYGAFLGSFLSLFESSLRFLKLKSWLRRTSGISHHRSMRVILAAVGAGTVAIQFLPQDTRLGIAMFFLVRALEILTRWIVEREEKLYQGGAPQQINGQDAADPAAIAMSPQASVPSAVDVAVVPNSVSDAPVPPSTAVVAVDTQSSMTLPPPSSLERARRSLKALVLRIAALPASDHFDTLVMALASSQIIWAWLFNRSTVEPVYLRFLDQHGGRAACVQHAYVDLHRGNRRIEPKWLDQINAARSSEGRGMLDLSGQPLTKLMCEVLHRDTTSCTRATFSFFQKAYLRALPVYLPVYLLPMLLFKHKQLLKHPLAILLPTALNLARSSLFLSSYCTMAWAVACFFTHAGLTNSLKGALAGFAGGSMVAMEKKGRRVELALYVLSQALPSTWRTLHQWGVAPLLPHAESGCFVAAMSVIMWAYVTRPHLMRSSYLSLFLFFFGSGGRSAGFSTRAIEARNTSKPIEDKHRKDSPAGTAEHRLAAAAAAGSPQPPAEQTVAASASLVSPSPRLLPLPVATSHASASSLSGLPSPGALVMLSRHSSRLSTVSDEPEETASPSDSQIEPRERPSASAGSSVSASPSPPLPAHTSRP